MAIRGKAACPNVSVSNAETIKILPAQVAVRRLHDPEKRPVVRFVTVVRG